MAIVVGYRVEPGEPLFRDGIERRPIPIPGWEDAYADAEGHIWTVWEIKGHTYVTRLHERYTSCRCYRSVMRTRRGRIFAKKVHVLVTSAFHGLGRGRHVRHLNGDSFDNRPDNLTWGTAKENAADKRRHGRIVQGVRMHTAQLTDEKVRRIREMAAGGMPRGRRGEIAKEIGCTRRMVSDVLLGRTWRHVQRDSVA